MMMCSHCGTQVVDSGNTGRPAASRCSVHGAPAEPTSKRGLRRRSARGRIVAVAGALAAVMLAMGAGCKQSADANATAGPTSGKQSRDASPPSKPKKAKKVKVAVLEEQCKTGDGSKCRALAKRLRTSSPPQAEVVRAVAAYKEACDKNVALGCGELAWVYSSWDSVCEVGSSSIRCSLVPNKKKWPPADDKLAVGLFEKACAGGAGHACGGLAIWELKGKGHRPNPRKANELFQKACAAGISYDCAILGFRLQHGKGGRPDARRAAAFYERACNGGFAYGCLWGERLYAARGAYTNPERAEALASKGCKLGNSSACDDAEELKKELEKARMEATAINAHTLWADYDANEVAADNKYKGKHLVVHGVVQSITKDFTNAIVVQLRSPNEFSPVAAYVRKSQAEHAANLRKREEVYMACKCDGSTMGSPVLTDCVFK